MWRTPSGDTVDTGQEMLSVWSVSSNITISNITAAEGGNYTCIAGNEAGSSEASATLFVSVYVVSDQMDLSTTNGSVESVACMIVAFPPPDYRWEKLNESEETGSGSGSGFMFSGSALFSGEMMPPMRYDLVSSGQILEFDPVLFGDEGVYRCVALAEVGGEVISNTITVTSE